MTRKQFEELDCFKGTEEFDVDSIVLLPTKRHDQSGYNVFFVVACNRNKPVGICYGYDTFSIIMESKWNRVGIDCLRGSGFMRIFLPPNEYVIKPYMHQIELKQKAIMPKFRTYQPIFYITQYYTSTKGNPEYDIISDKYYVAENENEIILGWNYAKDFNQRKYYYVRKDWVFATLEEAEQKLAEIGEKDE